LTVEILVLHPGALGDLILALPALRLLRTRIRGAHVTLAANLDYAAAVAAGYADRCISLSTLPLHRLYEEGALPAADVRFWTSFDRILSWTGAGSAEFSKRLSLIHPQAKVAAWKPLGREIRHVSRIFADSLYPWIQATPRVSLPRIRLSPADLLEGEKWLSERGVRTEDFLVGIHPGAGNAGKRWPLERFEELLDRLLCSASCTILILEGPAEPGLGRRLAQREPSPEVLVAESLPLPLLAGILSRCGAFVGNDSGIAHLAAGLLIPSIVLFGPAPPRQWAPRGRHAAVLRNNRGCHACEGREGVAHQCLANIPVEAVWSRLQHNLPRRS
jgi:heptosyltransferase III